MSDLESEFQEAVDQINAKIKEAAKLLTEARKIGKDAGIDKLTFDRWEDSELEEDVEEAMAEIDFGPLLDEMDAAGWSTSSLGC